MISQCWGIHNNNCTEVAMNGSIFCESCAKEYSEACDLAEKAAKKPQDRRIGDLMKNMGDGCKRHE